MMLPVVFVWFHMIDLLGDWHVLKLSKACSLAASLLRWSRAGEILYLGNLKMDFVDLISIIWKKKSCSIAIFLLKVVQFGLFSKWLALFWKVKSCNTFFGNYDVAKLFVQLFQTLFWKDFFAFLLRKIKNVILIENFVKDIFLFAYLLD